ncbi:hypothetical protein [Paenibacillus koleovorans]|uniref:hypothetical protein n=1 Tax=Paenibacillus koleovorans TaxID=121608 RepID=UPI000FDA69BD|nr:hypothetical protein [Paenibacillus koleovorans]
MATDALHDFRMVGSTSSGGGKFRAVRTTGEVVFTGDVTAESCSFMGEVQVKGSLETRKLKLTGQCSVEQDLVLEQSGGVGQLAVGGSIRGGQLRLSGHVQAGRSCEAEGMKLTGLVDVGELISAEQLELSLHGNCQAREIGGGTVVVKRSQLSKIKSLLSLKEAGTMTCELIEGDVVHLEYVTADLVRGARVTIGNGCRIGRVEYRESLERHPKATIGSESRV